MAAGPGEPIPFESGRDRHPVHLGSNERNMVTWLGISRSGTHTHVSTHCLLDNCREVDMRDATPMRDPKVWHLEK
jgi:hypothetical protein